MSDIYRCLHNYKYGRSDRGDRRCPNRTVPGSVYCLEHRAGHLARVQAVPPKLYKVTPLRFVTKGWLSNRRDP